MPSIQVPKINQPIIVLFISLTALYLSELNNLRRLYLISLILSIIIGIVVAISVIYYTYDYNKRKLWNARWNTRLLDEKKRLI